jgi:hypothetical protein
MPDPTKLPQSLLSSVDPVNRNPFPETDLRHGAWNEATRVATEAVHRLNAKVLEQSRERALEGVPGYHKTMNDLAIGKFDIWARRGIAVVWDAPMVTVFVRFLFTLAEDWLRLVKAEAEQCERDTGRDFFVETLLVGLKVSLIQRLEYWRAEGQKYAAEQTAYFETLKATKQTRDRIVTRATIARRERLVRAFRKKNGMTVPDLARRAGVSETALRGVIKEDRRRFGEGSQEALLGALSISAEDWYRADD